jgi:hypothetical protein
MEAIYTAITSDLPKKVHSTSILSAHFPNGGTPTVNTLLDADPGINIPLYVGRFKLPFTKDFQVFPFPFEIRRGHHGAEGQEGMTSEPFSLPRRMWCRTRGIK